MNATIRIGAIFAESFRQLRRHFIALCLLGLLQCLWLANLLYGSEIAEWIISITNHDNVWWYEQVSPKLVPVLIGFYCLLFILASMIIVIRVAAVEGRVVGVLYLTRRFLPTLSAVALALGIIILSFIAAAWLADKAQVRFDGGFEPVFLLVLAIFLIGLASLMFLVLPVAVMERGGPIRAFVRSFQLARGQRWRVVAIVLIMLLLLGIAIVPVLFRPAVDEGEDTEWPRWLLFAGVQVFMLALTLVITSTYRATLRISDGLQHQDIQGVFD